MRISRRLARERAQAEALRGVERRRLDAAVIERQAFRLAVFEEQLAVVHAVQGLLDDLLDARAIHSGLGEKQRVGVGEIGHSATLLGAGRAGVLMRALATAGRAAPAKRDGRGGRAP